MAAPVSPPTEDPVKLGFRRQRMTDWFAPGQLARTGLQSVISGLFGTYADRRELQACLSDFRIFDYSRQVDEEGNLVSQKECRIDFVSDLGDGFSPTYAVAYLLGQETLYLDEYPTSRGDILIMGGDQVYPTPGVDGYNHRLIGPYRAAKSYIKEKPPSVFAIPGNHDWYDGLSAFLKTFCQPDRWMGAWQTQQQRSYFAIKLPNNWWLWGIDIQLCADIDHPQQEYFKRVATQEAKPGDQIILCTAEPAWVYPAYKRDKLSLKNFEVFCQKHIRDYQLDLALTLTGDLHHYASYYCEEGGDWKITAGGGGAFMHPTHQLPDQVTVEDFAEDSAKLKNYKRTYLKSAFFPEKAQSRKMAFWDMAFPVFNPYFTGLMVGLYALFAWAWYTHSWLSALVIVVAHGVGVFTFSDRSVKKQVQATVAGAIHALLQVALLLAVTLALQNWVTPASLHWQDIGSALLNGLLGTVIGGILSSFLMGFYLFCCTLLIGNHETEAFSSFRGQDYKNFLRLHLTAEGLTIYPVGIRKVPRKWHYQPNVTNGQPWYEPAQPLQAELIQSPIHIPSKHIHSQPASPEAQAVSV